MLKVFISLYVVLFSTVTSTGQKFRSDYKYIESVGGWLKYHFVPATWNDARLRCYVEGGVLASPLREDLTSILINTMKEEEASAIFTGIHATYSKGDFVSIEGVPLRDIPILRRYFEIDNKNNEEQCLIMSRSGTIADVKCEHVYPYICYKAYDPQMAEPNECGTIDRGYSYSVETGHCYKFHSYGQPWDRAYMTCAAEGGYLAIINSEKEAEILKDLFWRHPANTIIGRSKDWAHVGFKSDKENNFWITVDGKSLRDAGYSKWREGEPNNASEPLLEYGQHCGNIHRSSMVDDNHCLGSSPFICEKHPDTLQ